MQHRNLHDVAGGALDRHVDGFAFGGATDVGVAIVDARQRTDAAVERSHKAVFAGLHRDFIHVAAHAFVGRVIIIDYFAGFLPRNAHALRQTPWLDRIGNCEVHNFGEASSFLEFFVGLRSKHQPRSPRVNIIAVAKSIQHYFIAGDVRQQTQLELRIIGGH